MKAKAAVGRRADPNVEPSSLVQRFGLVIADATAGKPIADIACGSGRNAIFLSQLGCTVICVDKDLTRLQTQQSRWCGTSFRTASSRLITQRIDLIKDAWPFGPGVIGGVVNVHFFL